MIRKLVVVLMIVFMLFVCKNEISTELLREPMVGIIQNHEVAILVKTISENNLRIEYRENNTESSSFTDWEKLTKENAFTGNLILKNLKYDTDYQYRIEFKNGTYSKLYTFKTFPEQGKPGKFSFIFSSGMREKYATPYVYDNIAKMSPTFVALLGDQIYGDYDGNLNKLEEYLANDELRNEKIAKGEVMLKEKTVLDAFRGKYHRAFMETFQNMSAGTPIMGIWDDHDMGQDNNDGTYPYKEIARQAFIETYPSYPFEVENEGLYYRFSIADVDAFVLDTRWYRSPMEEAGGEDEIMLGAEQLAWLQNGLKESKAKIKIIFSSIPFNDYGGDTSSKRKGNDGWQGFVHARSRVLSFIKENNISGVVVFSADQHYPSTHILNWEKPLKSLEETKSSISYSLSELNDAIFDFSAGPFNYKRATGFALIPENQNDTSISYEVYRSEWSKPENYDKYKPYVGTSVYGLAEINTESSPATITVKFYEMDKETKDMVELYKITLTE